VVPNLNLGQDYPEDFCGCPHSLQTSTRSLPQNRSQMLHSQILSCPPNDTLSLNTLLSILQSIYVRVKNAFKLMLTMKLHLLFYLQRIKDNDKVFKLHFIKRHTIPNFGWGNETVLLNKSLQHFIVLANFSTDI
jgi:hypothetical protein